jgi:hypothetical protein
MVTGIYLYANTVVGIHWGESTNQPKLLCN